MLLDKSNTARGLIQIVGMEKLNSSKPEVNPEHFRCGPKTRSRNIVRE